MQDETLAQFEQHLAGNPLAQKLFEVASKHFLESEGIATDKLTSGQIVSALDLLCAAATPLCAFVQTLPTT
jgi:hypothetical protein